MTTKRRIAVFMGTRPEAIKLAPVVAALDAAGDMTPLVVATGQHREMFRQVADLFGFAVHADLDAMRPNQSLARLSSRLMLRIDRWLAREAPDLAVVQGDTTTVLIAALACFYRGVPVAHVEAGLRTGNLRSPFPEEANRRLASHVVSLHLAPTEAARENLRREGIDAASIEVTGNTVIDALLLEAGRQDAEDVRRGIDERLSALIAPDWSRVPFVLITGHRRENFGGGFDQICDAIARLASRFPGHRFVYPVHLNPNVKGPVHGRLGGRANVALIQPVDYRLFVALMRACRLILTDSGGVQEEAPSLGKPVLVMRDTTERPEGVAAGTVLLTGPDADRIEVHAARLLTDPAAYRTMAEAINPYGDGRAAGRVVAGIRRFLDARPT